jgi:transposase
MKHPPDQGVGVCPTVIEEDAVANSMALSRGDRRRNHKLARLREVVRPEVAILAIDLASAKQAVVVANHDSMILGRRMFEGSPWSIDAIVAWALPIAAGAGFGGVVVACEPTGHRWHAIWERTGVLGLAMVCVQPLLTGQGRQGEDFTRDRSDFKDATIIARLTAELRCYLPYVPEGPWARLRHLGARRSAQLAVASAARQAVRDLLEFAWPEVLVAAGDPLRSKTWCAALSVSDGPAAIVALGPERFGVAVQAELAGWHGRRYNRRILAAIYAAAVSAGQADALKAAALERAWFALGDLCRARDQIAMVEDRMRELLDTMGLTELVVTIDGLSAVGAAAILAETGDPARYDCARTWVKHAGLCPRANESGRFKGRTTISRRGRPGLRTAAWRAIWVALHNNEVYAARYHHLRSRPDNRLSDGQARVVLAGALLRQLFVVVSRRVAWDARIAAGSIKAEASQAA